MGTTTFSGPVRSEGGFQSVTKSDTTGAVTVGSTFGTNTEIAGTLEVTGNLTATATANVIVIPTTDPEVAGAIWNDAGTLSVSAG
jgi:hypothetical protein